MMNYRILLLILITALGVTACTAVEGRLDTATVVEPTRDAVEQYLERAEMQTVEPEPTQPPAPAEASVLPVIGPAPGWENEVWINSDGPLPLEELRGKVVLLEFWTFG